MKYSEFETEVEKLGWFVSGNKYEVHVINQGGGKLMVIDKTDTHVLDPDYIQYVSLTHEDKSALLDLSVKLAKTPLAERKEEKRFRLRKIPIPLLREASDRFYRKPLLSNYGPCTSSDITESFQYQIIFTESEIAEMDITGFEKVEVSE